MCIVCRASSGCEGLKVYMYNVIACFSSPYPPPFSTFGDISSTASISC